MNSGIPLLVPSAFDPVSKFDTVSVADFIICCHSRQEQGPGIDLAGCGVLACQAVLAVFLERMTLSWPVNFGRLTRRDPLDLTALRTKSMTSIRPY
jgi:hypothetical protein